MGQSLFQQYRSKMFKEIQYRVHDETGISLQTVIRRLEKQYSKWIDDLESLQPTEDQKKTIAMILWSQVHPLFPAAFPLALHFFSRSY